MTKGNDEQLADERIDAVLDGVTEENYAPPARPSVCSTTSPRSPRVTRVA